MTANSATKTYDGTEKTVSGVTDATFTNDKGAQFTVEGLSATVSGTDAGTYPNNVTGTAKVTDAAGNDVTSQFSVTTESGSLVINKAKATIAPKDATKAYDGTDLKASEFCNRGIREGPGRQERYLYWLPAERGYEQEWHRWLRSRRRNERQ